eukprot:13481280-Alexandrium_andersonii.AAC.1
MWAAHALGPSYLPGSHPLVSDEHLAAGLVWTLLGHEGDPPCVALWRRLGLPVFQRQILLVLNAGG